MGRQTRARMTIVVIISAFNTNRETNENPFVVSSVFPLGVDNFPLMASNERRSEFTTRIW